jgi:hypothetical protein
VTHAFEARLIASRRREKFGEGELLMRVDGPELPEQSRFQRISGLRPSRGVECQYIVESDDLTQNTQVAK